MGPPRTRRAISANPSRFQEGSMNDRVSAAPPVHFLGPKELAELECPVERSQSRPSSDDFSDKGVKKGRLFGRVWDEVRGRLGFREEGEDEKGSRRRGRSRKGDGDDNRRERSRVRSWSRGRNRSRGRQRERDESAKGASDERMHEDTPKEGPRADMPTREEILANYHHLVASGFFTSHAIQSTRQPPPGTMPAKAQANDLDASQFPPRSSTPQPPPPPRALTPSARPRSSAARSPPGPKQRLSREEPQASTYDELVATGFFVPPTPQFAHKPSPPTRAAPTPPTQPARSSRDFLQPPTPRWASRGGTPSASRTASPVPSPASASSRGTKRAADITSDDEADQEIALDPPTPKKKLRKTVTRDIAAAPKTRNGNARRGTNLRRSVSGPNSSAREHNNLARRVLGVLPGVNARNSVDVPDRNKQTVRRCASGASSKVPLQDLHTRVLRSRRSFVEALRPGQNSNRAPPRATASTSKFVSCEDGENGVPYLTLHL